MRSESHNLQELEYLRSQADENFQKIKSVWTDLGHWAAPHRTRALLGSEYGKRNNNHITDTTHITGLRSYKAGFLEGNTSTTRPWFKQKHPDDLMNKITSVKRWLDHFNDRCMRNLSRSNFYNEAPRFYGDYGVFNTGAHYITEYPGGFFFYTLDPGTYKPINNQWGTADILFIERKMNAKALVDEFGDKSASGSVRWDNFSPRVKQLYERQDYTQLVEFVIAVMPNPSFNANLAIGGRNRQWVTLTYEAAHGLASGGVQAIIDGLFSTVSKDNNRFLKISYSKRKPFIVGKSESSGNFEFGEDGPTLQALGLIKSLCKKAISKDKAIEKMIDPAVQGPANLRKSYVTTQTNRFVPLDPMTDRNGGLRTIHEVSPQIGTLVNDVEDMRKQVDKLYFADFLLFLSMNPKTRTATETQAILNEQQLVIGPNLQSLNWTYNDPVVEFVSDWTLDMDPYLAPPPQELQGHFLRTEYVSVFAQAQRAADLPNLERYWAMIQNVGQLDPSVLQKFNADKFADIYEDRLYLPEGINRDQAEVDQMRQQAQAAAQRQQALTEMIPAMAGAAKDAASAQQLRVAT